MIEKFIEYAPITGLLLFFFIFVGILVWAMRPSAKERLQKLAQIPLKEDANG